MTPEENDDILLARLRAGDRHALEAMGNEYRPRILRYLTSMLGDEGRAEELAQETFARALKALPAFRGECKLSTWLFQIACNLGRSAFRGSAAKKVVALESEPVEAAGRSALTSAIRHESAELIALAIDRLPPILREAFVLHYVEGLEYKEIGAITGVAPGTLQIRALRARGLLRRRLGNVVDTVWREDAAEG